MKNLVLILMLCAVAKVRAGDVVNYAPQSEIVAAQTSALIKLAKQADAAWEKAFRSLKVGASVTDCVAVLGTPKDVNRTKSEGGTFDQWVYGAGHYLHFQNGVLVSISY